MINNTHNILKYCMCHTNDKILHVINLFSIIITIIIKRLFRKFNYKLLIGKYFY